MSNKTRLGLVITVLLFGVFFLLGRCSKTCRTQTLNIPVVIPEKRDSFPTKGDLVPIETKEITKILYKDSIITVPTVNQDLVDKYLQTKEELDKLKLYTEAIKINNYETKFDNKDLELTIKSKTEGKLLEITPSYVIKQQNINVPVEIPKPKERVFSMNVGAQITATKDLAKFDPSVKVDLVNKKGHILTGSYSLDGVIGVGYSVNLFDIKK